MGQLTSFVAGVSDGARQPSLALDFNAVPHVAFTIQESGGINRTEVHDCAGAWWNYETLDATSGSAPHTHVRIAHDSSGMLNAAWVQSDFNSARQVFYARRPAAGGWESVSYAGEPSNGSDGISQVGSVIGHPIIAFSPPTTWPWVAWSAVDPVNPAESLVMAVGLQQSGTNLVWRGPNLSASPARVSDGVASVADSRPSAAFANTGELFVAWTGQHTTGPVVYLRSLGSTSTQFTDPFPGSGSGAGVFGSNAVDPSLAFGPRQQPCLAFTSEGASATLQVGCYDGSSWMQVSGTSSSGFTEILSTTGERGARDAALIIEDGGSGTDNPIVAWSNADNVAGHAQILLARFDGNTWRGIAGSGGGAGISNIPPSIGLHARRPSLDIRYIDPMHRRLCVSWLETDNDPFNPPASQVSVRCILLRN